MNKIIAGVLFALLSGVGNLVLANQDPVQRPNYEPFVAQDVSSTRAALVFVRSAGRSELGTASIFLDDRYHTSLVSGSYVSACMTPGPVEIRLNAVSSGAPDVALNPLQLELRPGATHFVQVVEQARRRFLLRVLDAAQAKEALVSTSLAPHTISRVPRISDCIDPNAPKVAAPVGPERVVPAAGTESASTPARVSFAGDTLFAFGKSGMADLSTAGRLSLDRFVDALPSQYARIDSIRVLGFADPLGRPELNQRLSEERAASVRTYLIGRGVPSSSVVSAGRGSSELAVAGCPPELSAASVLCNAPNRRVTLEIFGLPKKP